MIEPRMPTSNVEIGEHYDELDDYYRQIWGEHVHHGRWITGNESVETAVTNLVDAAADAVHAARGVHICDVGSGYGAAARYLAENYGAHVAALTLSERQYEHARGRPSADGHVDYLLGDWFKNDFSDRAFDAVVAIESTAHMADKAGFFREVYRVLRPGGRAAVCAWLSAERPAEWQVRYLLEPICRDGRLPGLGTMAEYERWIDAAGLELIAVEDWSTQVRRTWSICCRRIIAQLVGDPTYIRYLLDPTKKNRRFLFMLPRVWLAYRVRVMRYGFFNIRRLD